MTALGFTLLVGGFIFFALEQNTLYPSPQRLQEVMALLTFIGAGLIILGIVIKLWEVMP